MIHTSRTVTVGKMESVINEPIMLYRGDREVEIEFNIVGSKFMFSNGGNVIKSTNATNGQLVINTPTGENMFSEVTECNDGKVVCVITKEMIDELAEVGFYSFQIRLFDESQVSRVTIPPVYQGIEIRNPIAAEDETDLVDIGLVDFSVVRKDNYENVVTFLPNGDYNKTLWEEHDVISKDRLNKVEDALYEINKGTEGLYPTFQNQYDEFSAKVNKDVKAYKEEMEDEVEQFERDMTQAFGEFKVDYKDDMYDRMDVVEGELESKTDKNNISVNVKDFGAKGDGVTDDTHAIKTAILSVGGEYHKGGTVYIPRGRYKITDTIFIPSNVNILGDGRSSYFSSFKDEVGSCLIFECDDIEKPCISFIFEKNGDVKNYNYIVSGANLDNNVVRQSVTSSLKKMTIVSTIGHNVGIVFSGNPLSYIEDVAIKGFLGGIIVSGNWASHINRTFINTSIFGILLYQNVNNLQISNCYIDKTGDITLNESNKLYSYINDPDFYLSETRTGIYARYAYNLKVINTCIEHWDVGIQVAGAGAATSWDTIWLELNAQPITLSSYQHTLRNIYVFGSTSDNVILATGTNLSLENFNGQYGKLFKDTFKRHCEVVFNNCMDNGTRIMFLNSKDTLDKVFVDEINGSDFYFGNETMPVASLQKAFEIVKDGGEIILKSDITVTEANRITNKRVTIIGDGAKRTISPKKSDNYIRPIELYNSSILFTNVIIDCYLDTNNAHDTSYSAFIKPIGMFNNEVSFDNCTIRTKMNYGIIQHEYGDGNNSFLRLVLQNGEITGDGAMSRNAYTPSGTLYIDEYKRKCSIDSTVTTYGSSSVISTR